MALPLLPPAQPELEISVASNGMSKGISQTSGPQVVGRGKLDWGHITVAALAKNVTAENSDAEVQFSIGGSFAWAGTNVTGSVAYKRAITSIGDADDQAVELGLGASHPLDRLVARAQILVSPNDLGSAKGSIYAELGVDWPASPRLNVGGSIGRRERGNQVDYNFANLGISYALGRRFIAEVRGYATDKSGSGDRYKPRLVGTVRARF